MGRSCCSSWHSDLLTQADGKPECTSSCGFTFNSDFALHAFDDSSTNCESKAGSSILSSRRGIDLRERLKKVWQAIVRDPNPSISNGKTKSDIVCGGLYQVSMQGYLSGF